VYDERARALLRAWKEHGRRRLAREAAALVAEVVARPDAVALVHVPGDPERALERGAVAPERLASELAQLWALPALDRLRRTGPHARQRGLDLASRMRNVRGGIVATGETTATVCLVDDVYTSGATADACARALRRVGARRVEVVTLARAVR